MSSSIERYQKQLLQKARRIYYETPISQATEAAFLATPRHLFIKRYRIWGTREWIQVTAESLQEHLARLYMDEPLLLFGEDDDNVPSTISQPSFVLRMLDMLRLSPGQRVFELGAGSGWSAALMARLVGPDGHVDTVEIIPELTRTAAACIEALGIKNVDVIEGDAGDGHASGAPYDRAVLTAGTYDLPRCFYDQINVGGLLLAPIKNSGGGDNLFLLRRTTDGFESLESVPCGFVQFTGKYKIDSLDPMPVETLPQWSDLQQQEISRTPFWWAGKGRDQFAWRTYGVRSFLSITEPHFRAFKSIRRSDRSREESYFGLWDENSRSLVVAKDDCLIAYGNCQAKDRLLQDLRQWLELGMPSGANFTLNIHPIDQNLSPRERQWLVKRNESQFLWTLP